MAIVPIIPPPGRPMLLAYQVNTSNGGSYTKYELYKAPVPAFVSIAKNPRPDLGADV